MDQADGLRTLMKEGPGRSTPGESSIVPDRCPKVISVASGKGGVGKTNVVANIGFALAQFGRRVMIMDADLGLANVDVLLGLTPQYTIQHFFDRSRSFSEILVKGPGGMSILPASSGVCELVDLKEHQKLFLMNEMDLMANEIDFLLIDTGAGISSNVLYFNLAAQESIVIVTPEPTSITDAYALIKVLSNRFKKDRFLILVNRAENEEEAREVFRKISRVADHFLDHVSTDYLGFVPEDDKLPLAVKRQRAVLDLYPGAVSSRSFKALARRLMEKPVGSGGDGQIRFFWQQLLRSHHPWEEKGDIG
jgi:flagellar biosynthesis protein FlhG